MSGFGVRAWVVIGRVGGGWQLDGGIAKAEWPSLARGVAADLEGDRDVTNARAVTPFDAAGAHAPPGNRVQALAARLRA